MLVVDVFSESCGDDLLHVVPITAEMLPAVREARSRISHKSWNMYALGRNIHLNEVTKHRPLRPGDEGRVYYALIIDGEIVGLSDHYYNVGVWSENLNVNGGLVVLDEHQRKGIATSYAKISVRIAKYMGVQFFNGETRKDSPMHKIRARDGWEVLETFKRHGEDWVRIRLALDIKT